MSGVNEERTITSKPACHALKQHKIEATIQGGLREVADLRSDQLMGTRSRSYAARSKVTVVLNPRVWVRLLSWETVHHRIELRDRNLIFTWGRIVKNLLLIIGRSSWSKILQLSGPSEPLWGLGMSCCPTAWLISCNGPLNEHVRIFTVVFIHFSSILRKTNLR